MKLDTEKDGLGSIFKPYQIKAIEILLEKKEHMSSGEVWLAILKAEVKISRASVIFFLNDLVDDGLAKFTEETGKGGHHRLYRLVTDDRAEFGSVLADRFIYKLWEIFPNYERLSELMKT